MTVSACRLGAHHAVALVARAPLCHWVSQKIPGVKEQAAQIIISEVGLDMTRWKTEKQFSSFLGLCPNNSISGDKVLRRSTRKVYNRAADALRLCSQSLTNRGSDSRWTKNNVKPMRNRF